MKDSMIQKSRTLASIVIFFFSVISMKAQAPSYVPEDGLVGWWPFNGNANDESGNNNHGTVMGPALTTGMRNEPNSAYQFYAGSDLICTTTQMPAPQSLTYAAWMKSTNPGVLMTFNAGQCKHEFNWDRAFVVDDSASIRFYTFQGGELNHTAATKILDGLWHHIVVTMNINGSTIYVDGQMLSRKAEQNNGQDYSGWFRFGGLSPNDLNNSMIGTIDDIGIWNRALSAKEVSDLYSSKKCSFSISSDSILGYRNVETHQVVTYALRNNPALSYKWIATGGYMLGASTNHFCDMIWGYDKNGSVCCIVSDSTCSDTICVTTTINNKTTGGIAGGDVDVPTMSVKPNPAADVIDISTALGDKQAHFELVDVTGLVVQRVQGIYTRMSVSDVAPGVYHIVQRDDMGNVLGMERVVIKR